MEVVNEYLPAVLQAIGGLVIVATIAVRLTPSKGDDESVGKVAKYFFRLLQFLPTIGVNPQTKKIEEAYKDLKK